METAKPSRPEGTRRRRAIPPVLLSAVFYPGAGQFSQGRWVFGIFYALAATLFLALLFLEILIPLYGMLQWALNLADRGGRGMADPPSISMARAGVWFAATILVYAANLADAVSAQRRMDRARRESDASEKQE